jgi:hypothetical protein
VAWKARLGGRRPASQALCSDLVTFLGFSFNRDERATISSPMELDEVIALSGIRRLCSWLRRLMYCYGSVSKFLTQEAQGEEEHTANLILGSTRERSR